MSDLLEQVYRAHHSAGGRYGFTYGGKQRAVLLQSWIGRGKRVLDLGCRDGTLESLFSESNAVTGADIDRQALLLGLQDGKLQRVVQLDLRAPLPFAAGAFDCVVCAEVLEHLPQPGLLLAEVARLLRLGGLFVGSVPNAFRLKNRILFLLGKDFERDPTHLQHFSIMGLTTLLTERFTGLTLLSTVGRFTWLDSRLFGNVLLWKCTKRPS